MKKNINKKVILAFSGGLDTSFCVPYLMEQGYEVVTVTVNTGGFTKKELLNISEKSKKLGAVKHYEVNAKKEMFEKIASYIIKFHALYQSSYPNMCADRYIIAEKVVNIAKKENTKFVAHGSSAMGNDQVRFDLSFMFLAPNFTILTPIKEIGGNRKKEEQYLKEKSLPFEIKHAKYSINKNILGATYSGLEIDQLKQADKNIFTLTKLISQKPQKHILSFLKGIPTHLNGKKMSGEEILSKMNIIAGSFGFGQEDYTGDCIIGIKGHIAFEAPGILTLIKAHNALQQVILTKQQQNIGEYISHQFAELLYNGKFFDSVLKDLQAFIDSQQKSVNGNVTLIFDSHQVKVSEISSPNSLINPKIATYAQQASWTAQDAKGFITLFGLQEKISAQKGELYE